MSRASTRRSPVEELSTKRLLTMTWLEGKGLLAWVDEPQETRNRIAELLFKAWWGPMTRFGVIHGDPHLGNYGLTENAERLHLLDFGCVRIFPPRFVEGVVELYRGLRDENQAQVAHAYEIWGFKNLSTPLIEALTLWARFIYGPLLEDRVRSIADGVSPRRIRTARSDGSAAALEVAGTGAHPARIRLHGPRRDRARRGVSASEGGAEFWEDVRRERRRLFDRSSAARQRDGADARRLGAYAPHRREQALVHRKERDQGARALAR
ncbi:MAG: AarF/UbiB family protein [Terricaulis sp.]